MYRYIYTEYMLNGASERRASGTMVTTCFSKSPRKACEMEGTVCYRLHGEDATPIMSREELWLGSRRIFCRWN